MQKPANRVIIYLYTKKCFESVEAISLSNGLNLVWVWHNITVHGSKCLPGEGKLPPASHFVPIPFLLHNSPLDPPLS
jgi:hypothetical protein